MNTQCSFTENRVLNENYGMLEQECQLSRHFSCHGTVVKFGGMYGVVVLMDEV